MKPKVLLGLLVIFGLAACTSAPPKSAKSVAAPSPSDQASGLAAEQQQLRDLIVTSNKHYEGYFAELQAVIAAPAFVSLGIDDQFQALTLASAAAPLTEIALERAYLDRAIALSGIGFDDQLTCLRMAVTSGYAAAAARSLALLARQWPDRLSSFDKELIVRTLRLAKDGAPHERFLALKELYAAHWKIEWEIEPSVYWSQLALQLLEKGTTSEAMDVAAHVTAPYVLIAMRADRRFDGIVAAHPAQFQVEAAAERELKFLQSLSDEHPKSLALKTRVMEALLHQQHYAAMLAASDYAVQEIKATNFPDKLYDDYIEEHGAYLNLRSTALQRVGREDEAVAQLVEAGHEGDLNQLIDLAFLYGALNRPKDALAVIDPIGAARTNAYGSMKVEMIRLQAAVQLGDRDQISRSMQYLKSHQADDPGSYLFALIVAKQSDPAAHYLITELQDKELRQGVLPDIQEYLPTPGTETELAIEAQWRSVIARKDVQAAIHKVGRVESYRLEAP
jgi:beta-barrel assembly-enhancing protease